MLDHAQTKQPPSARLASSSTGPEIHIHNHMHASRNEADTDRHQPHNTTVTTYDTRDIDLGSISCNKHPDPDFRLQTSGAGPSRVTTRKSASPEIIDLTGTSDTEDVRAAIHYQTTGDALWACAQGFGERTMRRKSFQNDFGGSRSGRMSRPMGNVAQPRHKFRVFHKCLPKLETRTYSRQSFCTHG